MMILKRLSLVFVFSATLSWLISPVWAEETEKTTVQKKSKAKKSAVKKDKQVKELSGISIIGNKEAPKSLYIVPWKNSEVGVRSTLTSGLLDESMRPIDKEVFSRELEFYELSHSK